MGSLEDGLVKDGPGWETMSISCTNYVIDRTKSIFFVSFIGLNKIWSTQKAVAGG
jgi:hypothetical protein